MERYKLELYVVGHSKISRDSIITLEDICKNEMEGNCEIEIIDVETDPDRAEQEQILAIPTLIRRSPAPERRLIGALTVKSRVMAGLETR